MHLHAHRRPRRHLPLVHRLHVHPPHTLPQSLRPRSAHRQARRPIQQVRDKLRLLLHQPRHIRRRHIGAESRLKPTDFHIPELRMLERLPIHKPARLPLLHQRIAVRHPLPFLAVNLCQLGLLPHRRLRGLLCPLGLLRPLGLFGFLDLLCLFGFLRLRLLLGRLLLLLFLALLLLLLLLLLIPLQLIRSHPHRRRKRPHAQLRIRPPLQRPLVIARRRFLLLRDLLELPPHLLEHTSIRVQHVIRRRCLARLIHLPTRRHIHQIVRGRIHQHAHHIRMPYQPVRQPPRFRLAQRDPTRLITKLLPVVRKVSVNLHPIKPVLAEQPIPIRVPALRQHRVHRPFPLRAIRLAHHTQIALLRHPLGRQPRSRRGVLHTHPEHPPIPIQIHRRILVEPPISIRVDRPRSRRLSRRLPLRLRILAIPLHPIRIQPRHHIHIPMRQRPRMVLRQRPRHSFRHRRRSPMPRVDTSHDQPRRSIFPRPRSVQPLDWNLPPQTTGGQSLLAHQNVAIAPHSP